MPIANLPSIPRIKNEMPEQAFGAYFHDLLTAAVTAACPGDCWGCVFPKGEPPR